MIANLPYYQANQETETRILAKEVQARELVQLILAMNGRAGRDPGIRDILKNIM